MTRERVEVVAGAESYSFDGGPVGVLLSHGFTGSPASMRPWGEHFAANGHSVRVPRLPGHGTTWKDMNRTGWQDWYNAVDTSLSELRDRCETVVAVGLSMGGCLVTRLAEQRPDAVDGLVLVNPAIASTRWDLKFIGLVHRLLPSVPGIGNDIKKPGTDEYGYDRVPLSALASMLQMWKDVRAQLDQVTAPVLFFRSEDDHVVADTLTRDLVLNGVSSSVTEYVSLKNSFHVATLDYDAPLIVERTDAFIAEHVLPHA